MTRSFKRLLRDSPEIDAWYKGWMLFCPIYFAEVGNDTAAVEPRHEILVPILWASEAVQYSAIWFLTMFDPNYEPMFMFKVAEEPFWVRGKDD